MPKRGLAALRTVEGLIARLALIAILLPILMKSAAAVVPLPADPVLSAISASLCLVADAGERDGSASPDHEPCCILCGPPASAALPTAGALPFILPDAARVPAPLPLALNPGGLQLTSLPGCISLRGPPVPA